MLSDFNNPVKKVVLPDYSNYIGAYGRLVEDAISKGVLYFVKNQHPIVKIVRRIYDLDPDLMVSYSRNKASLHAYLRKELYTGYDSEGRVKVNPLFSDGSDSYMIYNLGLPELDLLDQNIIDPLRFTPLKFISHGKTQLTPFPLDGSRNPKGDNSMVFLELHVGELILSYRAFVKLSNITNSDPDINAFVCRYVLMPAFRSYANIALFNRLHKVSKEEAIEDDPVDKRWGVFDYNTPMIKLAMKKALRSNMKFRIRDILSLSPSIDDYVNFYIVESKKNIVNTSFQNMSRLDTLVKILEIIPDRYRKKFNREVRATLMQRFTRGIHEELNRPFAGVNYDRFIDRIVYAIRLLDT